MTSRTATTPTKSDAVIEVDEVDVEGDDDEART